MAEKRTIELEVVSNSENAQQQFKDLRSIIKSTTEQIEELTKEFGENSDEVNQAKKQLNDLKNSYNQLSKSATDLGASFEDVYGEMQPLTARMGEAEDRLYELAAAGKQGTQEYRDLLEEVSRFKRVQQETDMTVDAASSTMANKLVGSLEGAAAATEVVTGAMGLMGTESEAVQETLLKVQSAMALAQGVQGMKEAGKSVSQLGSKLKETAIAQKILTGVQTVYNFVVGAGSNALKLFRVALVSTGIGAIVVAVGLLIANFDKFLEAIQPVIDALKSVGDFLGLTDFAGAEAHANEMARIDKEIKERERLAAIREENFNHEQKNYDREIALAEALGKDTKALTKAKIEGSIQFQKEKLKEIEMQTKGLQILIDEFAIRTGNKRKDRAAEALGNQVQERQNELLKTKTELIESIADSENQLRINEVNNNKKSADEAKAAGEKAREAAKKKREDYISNLQKQNEDAAKLEEEAENQKLALLQDGIEKEKALRQDQFNDYKDNFLKERTKEEQTALDNQYKEGKITREKYNQLTEDLQVNAYNKLTQQEKDILKNAKELLNKDLLAIDEKYQAEVKKRTEDFQKKMQEDEKQRRLAFDAEVEKMQEENYQASLSAQDKELYLIREKYAEMERLAAGNIEYEKTIAEIKGREIAAINEKYDKENEERKRAELERNVGFAKQGLTIIQDLTDLFGKKGVESARKAFKVKKAAQMASALIDTYMNATAAYGSQFLPIPDPSSPVRGGIAAGLAVAAGLVNVAKIGAQKFEGGGSSGGGGGGGGVSGGSISAGGGMQAPNFNVVGNNGLNQLAQLQQQPTQAYVVSGEVTSAQSLDRNRIQNATL